MGESPLYFWVAFASLRMAMALDLEHVRGIAERVTASSDLELVEVEFRGGGGKARMLRVYIDKPGGVTHADCEAVSRELGTILDVEDAVPGGSYTLEVSSPGLDRKLTRPQDFERFIGGLLKLTTREPVDGNRFFEGRLESYQDATLTLALQPAKTKRGKPAQTERRLKIALSNVDNANLVPEI